MTNTYDAMTNGNSDIPGHGDDQYQGDSWEMAMNAGNWGADRGIIFGLIMRSIRCTEQR